ncbi:FCD domain-containing protein [Xinfangfangia sp. CPCC 101601]|uniref:FCD domain-containing protein n=1 Tax=Pseudogemmobacter lacusdianii TaxID=3069608 RepID=A0ABU0VUN4_9RHOB|nr:FCD domain-containing protein [Xinfangfangia sp. CPCC 101601]MDQ2065263.1 FCD domain-containing protein [Xinfangfangia sp. CPCC 101601]
MARSTTLTEDAYRLLRRDILRGHWKPQEPLRMHQLSDRYGMGQSPLREALSRLQAERLVVLMPLRGFTVAPLTPVEMWDAINFRILLEAEALRLSIRDGDDAWESEIVAALHALVLQARRLEDSPSEADQDAFEARHHAFHHALIAGCKSPRMLEQFDRLYAECERYRIPNMAQGAKRDVQAEHRAIADATLARDFAKASALLAQHYRDTAVRVEAGFLRTA